MICHLIITYFSSCRTGITRNKVGFAQPISPLPHSLLLGNDDNDHGYDPLILFQTSMSVLLIPTIVTRMPMPFNCCNLPL